MLKANFKILSKNFLYISFSLIGLRKLDVSFSSNSTIDCKELFLF